MEADVSTGRALDASQQIIKSFIEEYKASPELWDPKDPHYSNKYRRAEAQDRLLTILRRLQADATRIDVRKKINTFRSNYNKKAGMVKAAEAQGREYVPTSWLFHELRFLDTIKKPDRKVETHENESEGVDCIEESADESATEMKFEVSYPSAMSYVEIGDNQDSFEQVQNSIDPEPADKKPKLVSHIVVDSTGNVVTQHRKPKQKPQVRRSEAKTERFSSSFNSAIEPIALVWSSKLQSLDPAQRLFAEKAINDILFEASLNNLQKGPLVINAGMSSVSYAESEGFPVEVQEEYIEYVSTDEGDVS